MDIIDLDARFDRAESFWEKEEIYFPMYLNISLVLCDVCIDEISGSWKKKLLTIIRSNVKILRRLATDRKELERTEWHEDSLRKIETT